MNRRLFLAAAISAAPAAIAVGASREAPEAALGRMTSENPPEPGFWYVGSRRFRVFCDGMLVERCVRVDIAGGKAWQRTFERQGKGGGPLVISYREFRGSIRVERIA